MTNHAIANPRLRIFLLVWAGQSLSAIGTQLTAFALGIWVYLQTGSIASYTLISFFALLPGMLLAPITGALVDRWDRQRAMIISNIGAGLVTVAMILLLLVGDLAVWHVYLIVGCYALFSSIHQPALAASITVLVPKAQFTRANAMVQVGLAVAQILAPILAGVLIERIQLVGIVAIDLVTFFIAIITLLIVRFPPVEASAPREQKGSLLRESAYGWSYIQARPGLLRLLLFVTWVNFATQMVVVLLTPLVLGFSTVSTLGTILSISGLGVLGGSVLASLWLRMDSRVNWMFGGVLLQGLLLLLGGLVPSVPLVAGAAFLYMFVSPIIISASQAIWQSKIAPEVQGRVFAIRRMVALSATPLAALLAGVLAESVFEPLLAPDGPLAGSVGRLIGVGPGRGIGLLLLVLGFGSLLVTALFYQMPQLRRVEDDLEDAVPDSRAAEVLA